MSKIGSKTVTKADIVDRVSNATGLTKVETEIVINGIMNTITSALENDRRVELRGFGTFEVRHRIARMGRNPQTGESIQIKASNTPGFKAGKALKDALN